MRYSAACIALLTFFAPMTGCVNRAKVAESRQFYMLSVDSPQRHSIQIPGILKIRQVRAEAPYDGQSFIFGLGGNRFHSDYYKQYIAPPDEQLTGLLAGWLRDGGVFSNVITGPSAAAPDYVLEPHLLELYCDISDKINPVVNVKVRFVLIRTNSTGAKIVLDKTCRKEIKPVCADGGAIAAAAGRAFEAVFADLTESLTGQM